MPAYIDHHIRKAEHIADYLGDCLRNPAAVDAPYLIARLQALKQVYRIAELRMQREYLYTLFESLDMLERDTSAITIKLVISANLFNLKSHLIYLQTKVR